MTDFAFGPPKYYHGTSEERSQNIEKEGLNPRRQKKSNLGSNDGKQVISMATNPGTARSYAPSKNHVVFEISVPDHIEKRLDKKSDYVRSPVRIPPKYLRRMDDHEVAESENKKVDQYKKWGHKYSP